MWAKNSWKAQVGDRRAVEIDSDPGVGVGLVGLVVLAAAEEAEPLLGDGVRRGARGVVELEEQLLRAALRLAPGVREGPAREAGGSAAEHNPCEERRPEPGLSERGGGGDAGRT